MTDYNDGKWHGWNGGERPVHPKSNGEFVFADGTITSIKPAGQWDWSDKELPIIAFRVTKPYKEPREWWALWSPSGNLIGNFSKQYAEGANKMHYQGNAEIIHVREVIE